jgi:hypothetical protein
MPTISAPTTRAPRLLVILPAVAFVLALLAAPLLVAPPAGAAAQATCRLRNVYVPGADAVIYDVDSADPFFDVALGARPSAASQSALHGYDHLPSGGGGGGQLHALGSGAVEVAISDDTDDYWFTSTADPVGDNADGNREVFHSDRVDITQVTHTTGGGNLAHSDVSASAEHGLVAFLSTRNPLGTNADGNAEVFRADVGGVLNQITVTTGNVQGGLDLSDDGLSIVFGSKANLGAGNNPDGNGEVWRWTVGGLFPVQLTSTTDGTQVPSPTFDGGRTVAYDLDTAQLSSGNADRNVEIFLEAAGGEAEQITHTTGGKNLEPELNQAGTVITFLTRTTLGGPNPGLALFPTRWARTGGFTRLSDAPAAAEDGVAPSPDAIGASPAVVSTSNQTGGNPDGGTDLFRAECRTFGDVTQEHPFWLDVEWMASNGITTGYGDGGYHPSDIVTRQAMSAFLYRLAGAPAYDPPAVATFPDVGLGNDFFAEIEWMNAFAIGQGYADDTFRPLAPVSRGAMSAFMYRLADPGFPQATQATFSDVGLAHPFFQEIAWMANAGITTGYDDDTYRPGAPVTRQAMSAFMHRLGLQEAPSPNV